jgi:hypothetical protein
MFFETPKRPASNGGTDADDENDDDYEPVDEDVRAYGKRNFGALANPYLTLYLYNKLFVDNQYGIREDGDTFMISDSAVTVDSRSDTTTHIKTCRGSKGLWQLLTRRKVDENLVSTTDLKR